MSARNTPLASSDPPLSVGLAAEDSPWRTVFDAHVHDLYRFLYMWTGNREDAEQLTIRVFLDVVCIHSSTGTAPAPEMTRQHLFQIARTVLAQHLRAFYQLPGEAISDSLILGWGTATTGDDPALGATPEERIIHMLGQLPTRDREVLMYRFLLKRSVKETASLMGLSPEDTIHLQFHALLAASQMAHTA